MTQDVKYLEILIWLEIMISRCFKTTGEEVNNHRMILRGKMSVISQHECINGGVGGRGGRRVRKRERERERERSLAHVHVHY